eukprot:CAMPEP_0203800994 /NCGR_PEP_ID=MMETSP0100_2-20121128/10959_1 /ASSEMBLY_ACC=CAM_ASM_000210 /TAXON_ID=96639 /ORGANISM=" , Strain NY0313808BC1" /LENGTH=130 /DNA_ID=CAMNT_0050707405 /DNA_START=125 /DNA_END=513 /DNA_ORIENTATION=-
MENLPVARLLLEKGFAEEYTECLTRSRPNAPSRHGHRFNSTRKMERGSTTGRSQQQNMHKHRASRSHRRVQQKSAEGHVRCGYTPTSRTRKGNFSSPLHWACYKGNLSLTCALLRFGFDPACVDTEGNTA